MNEVPPARRFRPLGRVRPSDTRSFHSPPLEYLWKWKEQIELSLYERGKDLFNEGLDLAFFDTTRTYFEGKGWPGNPNDVETLVGVVDRLQKRFRIRKVILVCDRGMVSKGNLKHLREAKYGYLVGMRMRRSLEGRPEVMGRPGRYRVVEPTLNVMAVKLISASPLKIRLQMAPNMP